MKAVLVDFDGTLVHLPTDYEAVRSALRLLFHAYGVKSTFQPLLSSLDEAERALESQGVSGAEAKRVRRQAEETIALEERAAIPASRVVDGAAEFLSLLRSRGVRIAVVTNNVRSTVELAFRHHGLPSPDLIIGRGETDDYKPSPGPALAALRRLGVRTHESVLVGDDDRDARMGKAAGIQTILVGRKSPGVLSVQKLQDILELLGFNR